ncbi:MAG: hypothetical protein LBC59_09435 [Chitinispirillales bacterium]|jgi:hypothetical protein|nr:hypothetical protein [Chitinispirillales bacterium]
MARKTGLNPKTLQSIIMDAGVVYINYGSTDPLKPQRKLGATRGGSSFKLTSTTHDMAVDGITGIARGARRFLGITAEMTCNMVEISKELLQMALPGSTYGAPIPATDEEGVTITGENHYMIQRKLTATIPEIDYHDIAIVAEVSNTKAPVVCGLKNTISDGGLELSFQDGDESVLALTLTGTVDPFDPDTEGWFILYPEKSV